MTKRILSLAMAQLLLVYVLSACSPELSVEQQIIAVILDMEARIEAGERRPFIAHVAADFAGQDVAMTRDQLNALVLYQLRRYQRVHVQLLPIQVIAGAPGEAEAHFRVLLTGGPGVLPDHGQMYDVATSWQRQDDAWMLISAHWKPVVIGKIIDS